LSIAHRHAERYCTRIGDTKRIEEERLPACRASFFLPTDMAC